MEFIRHTKLLIQKTSFLIFWEFRKVSEELVDFIFNPQKIIGMNQNIAHEDRIDVMVQVEKNKRLKVIIQLDPFVDNQRCFGKVGIITAFFI